MAIVTIEDIIQHAERFEEMLVSYYENLAKHTERQGVRMLTDYMSRHRRRIESALEALPAERVRSVCSTPLRWEPEAADCRCFEGMELPDNATAEQVIDTAITFDECLVRLYRQVLQQPVDEEVKELVGGFLQVEQQDEIQLKKIKAMHYL